MFTNLATDFKYFFHIYFLFFQDVWNTTLNFYANLHIVIHSLVTMYALNFYIKKSVILLSENLITNMPLILLPESIRLLSSQIHLCWLWMLKLLVLIFFFYNSSISLGNLCCFILFGNISTVVNYYYYFFCGWEDLCHSSDVLSSG